MSSCSFQFSSPSEYDLHCHVWNASTQICACVYVVRILLYLVSKPVSDDAIERKFMRVYNDNHCTANGSRKKWVIKTQGAEKQRVEVKGKIEWKIRE